jgi:hypothetical protein
MKKRIDHSAHLRSLRKSEAARLGLSIDASIVMRRARLLLAVALIDGRLCRGEVVSSAELIALDQQLHEIDPPPAMAPLEVVLVDGNDCCSVCGGPKFVRGMWPEEEPTSQRAHPRGGPRPGEGGGSGGQGGAARNATCGYSKARRGSMGHARRDEILTEYGLPPGTHPDYEIDHLIPLCLGGSDDPSNLWPEPRRSTEPKWNAEAKDRLERFVCDMVCGGQLDIAAAQEAFAKDWIAAYHKYYETRAHRRQRALP